MKKILVLLCLVFACLRVWGANPSFDSFSTNDFRITTNVALVRLISLSTNFTGNASGTNTYYFYTIVTTNLYATYVITTNLYANNFTGTPNFLAKFIGDGASISNAPAYTTNNDNVVFIGEGGSTFYNSLQVPFLSAGNAVIDSGGYLTNGPSGVTINPTDGYLPVRSNATEFADSGFYKVANTNIGFDGQLILGPGTTNVVSRSGRVLNYTNNAPEIHLTASSGFLKLKASPAAVEGQTSVDVVWDTSKTVRFWSSLIHPLVSGIDLGADQTTSPQTPFHDLNLDGTARIWGYIPSVSTNYSRLAISHGGTNGSVVFNSQGSGIAGAARDFLWQSNGVTVAKVAADSGYTGTGQKVFKDNGMYSEWGLPDETFFHPIPLGGLSGMLFTNIIMTNLSAGVRDILTVPPGYIAYGFSGLFSNATNTSSILVNNFIHEGSNYRRLGSNIGVVTNNPGWNSTGVNKMLKPGEVLATTNGADGLSINATFRLIPTNAPLNMSRLFGLTTAPQKLYETPVGRLGFPLAVQAVSAVALGTIDLANDTGSNRTIKVYLVPSGGSVDESTLIYTITAGNGQVTNASVPVLTAGTEIWIESDTNDTLQSAMLAVYEKLSP